MRDPTEVLVGKMTHRSPELNRGAATLGRNEHLSLTGEIRDALGKVRTAPGAEVKESQFAVNKAFDDRAHAQAELPKFFESFRTLEHEMATLSELIDSHSEKNAAADDEPVAFADKALAAIVVLVVAGLGSIAALVIASIMKTCVASPSPSII